MQSAAVLVEVVVAVLAALGGAGVEVGEGVGDVTFTAASGGGGHNGSDEEELEGHFTSRR